MATPALRALRTAYPSARITGVMLPHVQELISGAWLDDKPWFDDFLNYHKSFDRRSARSVSRVELVRALRSLSLDVVILLTNSWWSAAVSYFARVHTIVGYDRDARGPFLTQKLVVPRRGRELQPISAVDYYLGLTSWLGCDANSKRMSLDVNEQDRARADRLWSAVKFDSARSTVVINSNAAKDGARVWPADKVRDLSLRLASERGLQVMLHCGPNEREANGPWQSWIRIGGLADHRDVRSLGRGTQSDRFPNPATCSGNEQRLLPHTRLHARTSIFNPRILLPTAQRLS